MRPLSTYIKLKNQYESVKEKKLPTTYMSSNGIVDLSEPILPINDDLIAGF